MPAQAIQLPPGLDAVSAGGVVAPSGVSQASPAGFQSMSSTQQQKRKISMGNRVAMGSQ